MEGNFELLSIILRREVEFCWMERGTCFELQALYGVSQRGELFNYAVFWRWIFMALLHAAVIFSLTYAIFYQGVLWKDGQVSGGFVFGAAAFTYVIVVVCLKAGLETSSWSVFTHFGIWGSIISWFIFLPIYSKIWPHLLQFGEDFVGIVSGTCVFRDRLNLFGRLLDWYVG